MATWTLGTRTALTGISATLANNAGGITAAFSNTSNHIYGQLEISVTWAAAVAVDQSIEIYFVQQTDGTNYEDATAASPAAIFPQQPAYTFITRAAATLRRTSPMVMVPPGDFKVYLINKSGSAFTAVSVWIRTATPA